MNGGCMKSKSDVRRKMKLQREADPAWAREIAARSGCEELFSCLDCRTCSATCPLALYMDIGPRRVVGLVREGFQHEALACQTIWLCASCYSCDVECPSRIRLTELMGALRREAVHRRIYPPDFPAPLPEQELCHAVDCGRGSGAWRVFRAALATMRTGCRHNRPANREIL